MREGHTPLPKEVTERGETENVYMPTSRKEGGETAQSLRAYFEAFPLRPESFPINR